MDTSHAFQSDSLGAEDFERLVAPYLPMLFAYSRAICGDYHAAQDVVQETVLIAFRKRGLFFPEADFGTWLRAIARREALSVRRKLARLNRSLDEAIEHVYENPAPVAETPRGTALAECLRTIAARMGSVLRGHYFQGLPLAELAVQLGMTPNAVKQLLYRARLNLQNCMEKRLSLENAE